MSKFKNKYRTDSHRASWWDYPQPAWYYVTICPYGRQWFFGKVKHKSMHLSPAGVLAEKFWCTIPDHFPHVQLGAYVVMPNHVHGILNFKTHVETLHRNVSGTESIRPKGNREHEMGKISPAAGSLATVIRSYKSVVTQQANRRDLPHGWQPNFYDRILRTELEIQEVSAYIRNNPAAWAEDEFYGKE